MSPLSVIVPIPIITEHPHDQVIELYTNNFKTTLCCKATGYNLVHWWTKDGEKLVSQNRYSNNGLFCYVIENTKPTDRGLYQCVVSNSAGSVSSRNANILIIGMLLYVCINYLLCSYKMFNT